LQFDAQAGELTELARHLQHVQEEERARLSRGLHDELGGVLLAARMDVTWMQRHAVGDDADVRMRLERLKQVLDQGIELKRRVVEELRPTLLDTMGCWPHSLAERGNLPARRPAVH
jgi:signal transduction histidine kinase